MEVTFYRGLLDSLNIKPHVWRIENKDGKSYKTAGDPFLNTQMSDEMRENYTAFLEDLYEILQLILPMEEIGLMMMEHLI